MADIIAKIGKYFADQESQMREMYAQAAAKAASASIPARSAVKAPVQPSRDDSFGGRPMSVDEAVVERPPSLLRRRLMNTGTGNIDEVDRKPQRLSELAPEKAKDVGLGGEGRKPDPAWTSRSDGEASSSTGSRSVMSMRDAALSSAASRKVKVLKKKKKLKKKKSEASDKEEQTQKKQQLEMKAEEGLARAQERARRIQMEKLQQQKQQQQERDANATRLQEEMRKIEEIRQKGKQFALRLRPQSAPSTPQSSQTTLASSRWKEASEVADEKPEKEKRAFLNELEREMHNQMMLELVVNERAHRKYTQEQQECAMLQSQIKKTSDRNDIRAERVRSLTEKKKQLENQIEHAQTEAMSCRQERHQLEEKSKKERLQRQREAEREIHARLRKEESQRLVDEERKQSDDAAEARTKAKLRVQSRASLLKRVLHGCDIRPEKAKSQNQEETIQEEKDPNDLRGRKAAFQQDHAGPEIAEFEEDGLFEDFAIAQPTAGVSTSPTKRVMYTPATSDGLGMPSTFQWRVPSLPMTQIHNILREELLTDMEVQTIRASDTAEGAVSMATTTGYQLTPGPSASGAHRGTR